MRASDVALEIMSDDGDDGTAVGPSGFIPTGQSLDLWPYDLAVVWSGAYDQGVMDGIMDVVVAGSSVLLVLTQVAQHEAWVAAVGQGIPLLEIRP